MSYDEESRFVQNRQQEMTLAFDLRAQIDNGIGNRVNLATQRVARASECRRQRSESRLAYDEQVDIATRALAA